MNIGLEVSQLVLGYEGNAFTSPIDLVVEKGEIVAILGPSGCGKSTLLNTIVGGAAPVAGDISQAGLSIIDFPTEKRGIGIMFQSPFLFPHLNVASNIAFGLKQQKLSRAAVTKRVAELLELVKLTGFDDRDVSQLSGGQAQRVALARALAPSPEVLLLDEPLSALDAELRNELGTELRAILKSQNITTIFVTHDRAEAEAVADRVLDWTWNL